MKSSLKERGSGSVSTAEELLNSLRKWAPPVIGKENVLLLMMAVTKPLLRFSITFMKKV